MREDWENPEYRRALWHTASHVLAEAVVSLYPKAKPTIGPPIEEGFYYDFFTDRPFTPQDLEKIGKKMTEILREKKDIEGEELSEKEAMEKFKDNRFKQELIKEFARKGKKITMFRQGKFYDLCKGGHVDNTKRIKAVKLLKTSASYWRGDSKKESLQRIYGIAFPKQSMLENYLERKEEAEKRNHIKLGKELDLFSMHEEAPGTVFFHAKGTIIWNELIAFARAEQRKRNYEEVMAPLILKKEIWLTSGHWDHYKDNMYFTKAEKDEYAVKPMNCPGNILIYKNRRHSYRDLPLRIAEFGMVHRHELSGVLNGLFRARKFTQDDAHLFCAPEQVEAEINELLSMAGHYYRTFGFEYHVELSTKPEKAMGSEETWEKAETALKNALEKSKTNYSLNEGDGAFYGPKIDFHIRDSLGRSWQLGTIQLDFQMPEKFGLKYIDGNDKEARPVMIHRAIFGSLERFIGILIEHYAGKFPLWLAPVQVKVISVSEKHNSYAEKVHKKFVEGGLRSELNTEPETVGYKVRQAELERVPYIVNAGEKEEKAGTIAVRGASGKVEFGVNVEKFIEALSEEITEKKQPVLK